MATSNEAGAGRTEDQRRAKASTPEESKRGGETIPQVTVAYVGDKLGMPQQFGRYRVQKKLGGGGMGAVFLVENTELQRAEALKVPHFEAGGDPEVRERFLREARAAGPPDHPTPRP